VSENKVLRKMFEAKSEEDMREWKKIAQLGA
jgi:hypothetical protein